MSTMAVLRRKAVPLLLVDWFDVVAAAGNAVSAEKPLLYHGKRDQAGRQAACVVAHKGVIGNLFLG